MHTQSECSTSVPDEMLDGASKDQSEEPCPGDQRTLRAAILGVPNAGKTTLVNQLLGQKVSKPSLWSIALEQFSSIISHKKMRSLLGASGSPSLPFAAVCCVSKETHHYKECGRSIYTGKQPNSELCSLTLPAC